MEEIAKTFADVCATAHFHEGAADIFRLPKQTSFAAETRAAMDRSRTLEQALAVYKKQVPSKP